MPLRRYKILKTAAIIIIFIFISLAAFYLYYLSPRYTVPILCYHSFGYQKDLLNVFPENFEKHMDYIKKKGYKVISLADLVEGIKKGKKFAHNTVVITIDDGFKNNYTYAYPVLKKYDYPATIFLITNLIGTDDNFLNWEEIKEMDKHNISFGGHTKNHVYLPSVDKEDILWDEIAGCKTVIEGYIGHPIDYFCYPAGGFTEKIKTVVNKAGYKGACTTNRGFNVFDRIDVYGLKRISVRNRDTSFSLWAKLSGYYNFFRKTKKGD